MLINKKGYLNNLDIVRFNGMWCLDIWFFKYFYGVIYGWISLYYFLDIVERDKFFLGYRSFWLGFCFCYLYIMSSLMYGNICWN